MAMKKIMMVVLAMMWLAGCSGMPVKSSSNMTNAPRIITQPPAGFVRVDIQNPDLEKQKVCFFEGSTMVQLIPDAKKGGWKYSRPAFFCLEIGGANSSINWHEYASVELPRNFSYVWAAQHRIIDVKSLLSNREYSPWGFPYYGAGRTGSSPDAIRYWMTTPSGGETYAGGLIRLNQKQSSVRPLFVNIEIDTRPYSAAITRGLTEAVYGR